MVLPITDDLFTEIEDNKSRYDAADKKDKSRYIQYFREVFEQYMQEIHGNRKTETLYKILVDEYYRQEEEREKERKRREPEAQRRQSSQSQPKRVFEFSESTRTSTLSSGKPPLGPSSKLQIDKLNVSDRTLNDEVRNLYQNRDSLSRTDWERVNELFTHFRPDEELEKARVFHAKETREDKLRLLSIIAFRRDVNDFLTRANVVEYFKNRGSFYTEEKLNEDPGHNKQLLLRFLKLLGYRGSTNFSLYELQQIMIDQFSESDRAGIKIPGRKPIQTPRTQIPVPAQSPLPVPAQSPLPAPYPAQGARVDFTGKVPSPPKEQQTRLAVPVPVPQSSDDEDVTVTLSPPRSGTGTSSSLGFRTVSTITQSQNKPPSTISQATQQIQSTTPSSPGFLQKTGNVIGSALFSGAKTVATATGSALITAGSATGSALINAGSAGLRKFSDVVSSTSNQPALVQDAVDSQPAESQQSAPASVSTRQPIFQVPLPQQDQASVSTRLPSQQSQGINTLQISKMLQDLQEAKNEIQRLQNLPTNSPRYKKIIEDLQEKIKEMDKDFLEKMREVRELNDTLTSKNRTIELLQGKVNKREEKIRELTDKLTADAAEVRRDPAEIERYESQIATAVSELRQLQTDLETVTAERDRALGDLALERNNVARLSQVNAQNEELQRQLIALQQQQQAIQQTAQLQVQLAGAQGELAGVRSIQQQQPAQGSDTLMLGINRLEQEKKILEDEILEKERTIENYKIIVQNANDQFTADMQVSANEIQRLNEALSDRERQIQELQQDPAFSTYVQNLQEAHKIEVGRLAVEINRLGELAQDNKLAGEAAVLLERGEANRVFQPRITQLEQTVQDLQRELAAAQQDAANARAAGAAPVAISPRITQQIQTLQDEVAQQSQLIKRQELALDTLRGTNQTLAAQVDEQGGRLTAANLIAEQLRQDIDNMNTQKKELEEQLKLTNDRLTRSILISDQERNKIRQAQTEYNRLIEEADEYINNLTERLDELNVQNEELQQNYDAAEDRAEQLQVELDNAQIRLNTIANDRQTNDNLIRESDRTIQQIQNELQREKEKVFENSGKIAELNRNIKREQENNQNLKRENEQILRIYDKAVADLTQKQVEIQNTQQERQIALNQQRQQFEAVLADVNATNAQRLQAAEAVARQAAQELEQAQNTIAQLRAPQAQVGANRQVVTRYHEVVRTERIVEQVPGPVQIQRVEVPVFVPDPNRPPIQIGQVQLQPVGARIAGAGRPGGGGGPPGPGAPGGGGGAGGPIGPIGPIGGGGRRGALPADNFPANVMQRNIFTSSTQFAPLPRRSDRRKATGPAPIAASPELVELLDLLNNYINSFLGPRAPDGGLAAAANRANITGVLAGATWIQIQDALRAQGMRSLNDITSQPDTLNQLMNSTDTQIAVSLIRRMKGDGALPLKWRPGEDVEEETILLKNVIQLPEQVKRKKSQDKFTYGTIVPAKGVYQIKRQGLKYIAVGEGKKATFNTERDAQYFISAGGWGRKVYGPRIAQVFGVRPKNLSQAVY